MRILGAFQRVTATVENNGEVFHHVVLDARNDDVSVCDIMTDGRSAWICVYWKCLLGTGVSHEHYSGGRTHVQDLKDLVEIQSPGDDLFPVVFYMQMSRNHVSFFLLSDIPFDLCHNPGFR